MLSKPKPVPIITLATGNTSVRTLKLSGLQQHPGSRRARSDALSPAHRGQIMLFTMALSPAGLVPLGLGRC